MKEFRKKTLFNAEKVKSKMHFCIQTVPKTYQIMTFVYLYTLNALQHPLHKLFQAFIEREHK